jgi:putative MATE family efflux protein
MRDLTRGPIPRHILTLALPIAVGMLVQTLYYLVDLYFVSRLGSVAIAGVGAAGNTMFLLMALTQALSVGTITSVSHAVGADDKPRANLVFNQAILLALVLAVATLLGGYLGLADLYISRIGADAETIAAGASYLRWVIPAMALHFATAAMGAALQGTGIVKPTMLVQMVTVLLNIVLTPILVAGWGTGRPMGVAGAGLASSLAAALGVVLMTLYFVKLERYVSFKPGLLSPRLPVLEKMLGVGLPAGGEFALMFVYMAVIYEVVSVFGSTAQAGFGIGMRMMQAVFLPALAIAFAVPAIAGQNFGARDATRVRATFRWASLMNVAFMLALTLFCQWRPEWLVSAFSSDPEVLEVASGFMRIVSWNFVASGLTFTCSGMFQGMGNTLPALAATGTRLLTFIGPAFWVSRQAGFQIEQVWYLSVATVAFQVVMSLLLLRRELGKRLSFEMAGEAALPEPGEAPG